MLYSNATGVPVHSHNQMTTTAITNVQMNRFQNLLRESRIRRRVSVLVNTTLTFLYGRMLPKAQYHFNVPSHQ